MRAQARVFQAARGEALPWVRPAAWAVLAGMIVAYALVFAYMSVLRHRSLHSNAFDLGNMNQAVWSTIHGEAFRFTNWDQGETRLAVHVEPILLLVAQVYRLRPQPETLLLLQSVALALGALPAYALARRRLGGELAGICFAAIYLLNPSLQAANLSDFHAVALAAPLLLAAWDSLDRRRYGWFALWALLALATKEDISLIVLAMGVYLFAVHGRRPLGLLFVAVGGLWFFASLYVVIPHYRVGEQSIFMARYAHLGDSLVGIVWNLLRHPGTVLVLAADPDRGRYIPRLLQSAAYLPLLAPGLVLLAAGPLGINFFSSFDWMYSGGGHYSASIVPFLVCAAVLGAARASRALAGLSSTPASRWASLVGMGILLAVGLDHRQRGFSPLAEGIVFPQLGDHERAVQEIAALIPPGAAVSAQSALNPHVSSRRELYVFPLRVEGARYVFIDVTTPTEPVSPLRFREEVEALLGTGEFRVRAARDGVALLERVPGGREAVLPPEFFSFARPRKSPDERRVVRLAGAVELQGFDLTRVDYLFGRKLVYRVRLFLRAVGPVREDLRPVLYVARPDGALVNAVDQFPTTAWLPLHAWPAGETLVVTSPPIWMGREGPGSVYLGLVRAEDPWGEEALVGPVSSPYDISADLFAGGRLYRLKRLR